MKNLFLALCLALFSCTAFGQAKTLIVKNLTRCTVYYVIQTSSTTAPCVLAASSSFIALAPGGSITYLYNTVPGLPAAPRYIIGAKVYSAPPSCFVSGAPQNIGEPCTGYPLLVSVSWLNGICELCGHGYAKWTPAPGIGGTATMTFYP
jgi:hypothetical protein